MNVRHRVHHILDPDRTDNLASRACNLFILGLIVLNVVSIVLESEQALQESLWSFFRRFEAFSVIVFTVEYAFRLWSCVESHRYAGAVAGRLRWARSPLAVVDLLAILPFYLPFLGLDLRILRSLRLFRVFRMAKLGRYSRAVQTLGHVIRAQRTELAVACFVMALLLVLGATAMYYAENEAQPRAFRSIPAAMWWAATTLTTVGYGDMCPVTTVGKVLAAVLAMLGVGMFALPTGILGAGFIEEVQKRRKEPGRCPHCGKVIDWPPHGERASPHEGA